MLAEAVMGVSALNTAFNMAKGLKEMNDAVVRNAAVIELQENILSAQEAQAALVKHIDQLEKQVAGFEAWETEKNRYKMQDFGGGTIAYELKPEEARGEPSHRICPNCYQNRHVSILQPQGRNAYKQVFFGCPNCKNQFALGVRQEPNIGRNSYSPR